MSYLVQKSQSFDFTRERYQQRPIISLCSSNRAPKFVLDICHQQEYTSSEVAGELNDHHSKGIDLVDQS